MFTRPLGHKREAAGRDRSFRRPACRCFACHDTGVITNGDGLVNQLLPDYDRNFDGQRLPGSDLPLICHCAAAYARAGRNGLPQGGLRGPDGLPVSGLASELSQEQVASLHRRRSEAWRQTERLMQDTRMARAAGDPEALPWFIAEVRQTLARQRARSAIAAGKADGPVRGSGRLQPLGAVIADTLTSADPLQQDREPGPQPPLKLRPTQPADRTGIGPSSGTD